MVQNCVVVVSLFIFFVFHCTQMICLRKNSHIKEKKKTRSKQRIALINVNEVYCVTRFFHFDHFSVYACVNLACFLSLTSSYQIFSKDIFKYLQTKIIIFNTIIFIQNVWPINRRWLIDLLYVHCITFIICYQIGWFICHQPIVYLDHCFYVCYQVNTFLLIW